jgi:RNA polymerase-binding transcription factor DksA
VTPRYKFDVERGKWLRQVERYSYQQIADEMGCSRSTVQRNLSRRARRKKRASDRRRRRESGVCRDCGRRVTSRRSDSLAFHERCWRCQREFRGQAARSRVILALWAWHGAYGRWPRAYEWNPAPSQLKRLSAARRAEVIERWNSSKWPSSSSVVQLFGSWSAAIDQANLKR